MDPVALGQGLLNLNRAFGNSEAQLRGYGDVLTSVSRKYGASADARAGLRARRWRRWPPRSGCPSPR